MLGTFFLLFAITLLSILSRTPWVKGKLGEHRVSKLLHKHLQPPTYQLLNDITVPSISGTTQIDHVVVSPYGIFVIETKNFKGWIFGSSRDKQWTQTTPGNKSHFFNPIRQNYGHIKALEAATGLSESAFHSIVVFVGSAQFKTTIPDEICSLRDLVGRIQLKGKRILTPDEVTSAIRAIESGRLEPGFKTDFEHVKNLGERFEGPIRDGVSQGVSMGIKQLVFAGGMKVIGLLLMVGLCFFALNIIQSTISNLPFTTQTPKAQIQSPSSNLQAPPDSNPFVQSTNSTRSNPQVQKQLNKADLANLQWEKSLRCAYSIDTNRCSCYDRKGIKANLELNRCRELATGERGMISQ